MADEKKSTGVFGKPADKSQSELPKVDPGQRVVGKSQEILDEQAKADADTRSDKAQNADANQALENAKDKLAEGGRVEAYGKHGSQDENNPLTQPEQLDAIDKGAVDMSQQPSVTLTTRGLSPSQLSAAAEAPSGAKTFSSHPLQKFKIGRFEFVKGTLTLSGDDLSEFEKLLDKLPISESRRITEVDQDAAERVAKRYQETQRIRGVETAGIRSNLRGNN